MLDAVENASENQAPTKTNWCEVTATFWRSPFAVASLTTIVCELMLFTSVIYGNSQVSQDIFLALTTIASAMMVAGLMPAWNRLRCDNEGLDQHAGLTHFHVQWDQVKSVTPVPGGIRISYVDYRNDRPVVRRSFLQNRYDLDSQSFRRMIEKQWLENAVLN